MSAPTREATCLARAAAFGVATLAQASPAHVAGGGALASMAILRPFHSRWRSPPWSWRVDGVTCCCVLRRRPHSSCSTRA